MRSLVVLYGLLLVFPSWNFLLRGCDDVTAVGCSSRSFLLPSFLMCKLQPPGSMATQCQFCFDGSQLLTGILLIWSPRTLRKKKMNFFVVIYHLECLWQTCLVLFKCITSFNRQCFPHLYSSATIKSWKKGLYSNALVCFVSHALKTQMT